MSMDEKHTKQSAGQLGGKATVQKHGKEHMSEIGKRGAQVTWSRYSLKPVGTSQYAMVYRETGAIKVIF
jgi:general stress protein YciG